MPSCPLTLGTREPVVMTHQPPPQALRLPHTSCLPHWLLQAGASSPSLPYPSAQPAITGGSPEEQ